MTLQVPHNKLYQETQELNFTDTNIFTLIGENGSGKSSILESVFQKYIEHENKKVISLNLMRIISLARFTLIIGGYDF